MVSFKRVYTVPILFNKNTIGGRLFISFPIVVFTAILFTGCSPFWSAYWHRLNTGICQLYPGPAHSKMEDATLVIDSPGDLKIGTLDGNLINSFGSTLFRILPGHHTFLFNFQIITNQERSGNTTTYTTFNGNPIEKSVDMKAGIVYVAKAGYSGGSWWVSISEAVQKE